MNKSNERKLSIIAAIIAAIIAVLHVIYCKRYIIVYSQSASILNWFRVVVLIGFAIVLGIGKRNISLLIVSIMLTIYNLVLFIFDLQYWLYWDIAYKILIICDVLALIIFTVFVILFCIPGLKEKAKKYKFLCIIPSIIMLIACIIYVFSKYELATLGYYGNIQVVKFFLLKSLLRTDCILYLFSGIWMMAYLTEPTTISAGDNFVFEDEEIGEAKIYNTNTSGQNVFIDIIMHTILLLVTCGIWKLIWIYKTTNYLNIVEGEEYRNPLNKLLLCIFVPFYIIYWTYISAQRIDKLADSKNITSDLSIICLILAIFIGIVPPILMQSKINEIATKIC